MPLPGEHCKPTGKDDFARFYLAVCQPCSHNDYCSILAHAGINGSASEWREDKGLRSCIRQEIQQ